MLVSVLCLFCAFVNIANGMLVNSWGTANQPKRLAFAIRDLFQESFQFATAAQRGVYPVADLKRNYTERWRDVTAEVIFLGYNGWLEDLTLNTSGLNDHGKLRRLILTGAEKTMTSERHSADTTHEHEQIICDRCMAIHAKSLHYAYESVFHTHETSGTLDSDRLTALISFQLTVEAGYDKATNKAYCQTGLEPILLSTEEERTSLGNVQMSRVGVFTFLAGHLDGWIQQHAASTILPSIQQRLDVSVRKMLSLHDPCERILFR